MDFLTSKLASYLQPKAEKYAFVLDFDAIEEIITDINFYRLNPDDENAEQNFINETINQTKQMRINLPNEHYHQDNENFLLFLHGEYDEDQEDEDQEDEPEESIEETVQTLLRTLQQDSHSMAHHPRNYTPLRRRNVDFWIHNFCEGWSGSAIIFKTSHQQRNNWVSQYLTDFAFLV